MRWIYCRHEPTTNLNFGYGVAARGARQVHQHALEHLRFFVNYARLDELRSRRPTPMPFAERPDFDRWILTELQHTIDDLPRGLRGLRHPRSAARAIEAFVEDLSNWYIRHNRRRFWKSDDDADMRAAYETLYECLDALVRLAAPMMPFVTEEMYQNLVRAVDARAPRERAPHRLPAWPTSSAMDQALTDEMRAIMRLNSLALSAREAKKIKVRQPLVADAHRPARRGRAAAPPSAFARCCSRTSTSRPSRRSSRAARAR